MAPNASLTYMPKTHGRYILVFVRPLIVKILDFPTSKHILLANDSFRKERLSISTFLIDQFHINLFFVVSGLSPKSNRSKIRVVRSLTVWIMSWRYADFRLPLHNGRGNVRFIISPIYDSIFVKSTDAKSAHYII
jgi:hypothetical protein